MLFLIGLYGARYIPAKYSICSFARYLVSVTPFSFWYMSVLQKQGLGRSEYPSICGDMISGNNSLVVGKNCSREVGSCEEELQRRSWKFWGEIAAEKLEVVGRNRSREVGG